MTRRKTLADLLNQGAPDIAPDLDVPEPMASGALRAMGWSLDRLSAQADEARDLKAKIEAGDHVVELDPSVIVSSFITDRIAIERDDEFDVLVKSIEEQGQQVPILVRPDPQGSDRYQVAYGHRRLQAAILLRRPVKAIVRAMNDVELVIAQAKENLERRDLSYIERAVFAWRLEERKFDRATIMTALGVDKADLSRLLSVASTVPGDLIQAIGPAPKVGRPRWVELCDLLKQPSARKKAAAVVAEPAFLSADTNQRFARVRQALATIQRPTASRPQPVLGTGGKILAKIDETPRGVALSLDEPGFRKFLLARLPALVQEFEQDPT